MTLQRTEALAWLALATALAALLLGFASGKLSARQVLHPEALYPQALLLSVADDPGAWRSWNTPPSPYLFPDVVLVALASGAVRASGGGAMATVYGFAVLQVLLLALAWRALAALLGGSAGSEAGPAAVAAWALVVALWGSGLHGGGALLWTLAAAFHAGVVVSGLWCVVLVLRQLAGEPTSRPPRAEAGLLAGCVMLTTFSDLLFLAFFVAPMLMVLVVEWLRRTPGALRAAVACCGGALIGWIARPGFESLGPSLASLGPIDHGVVVRRIVELLRARDPWFVADRFFEGLGWAYRGAFLVWLAVVSIVASGRWRSALSARGLDPACTTWLARWVLATTVTSTVATFWVTVGGVGARAGSDVLVFVQRYLLGLYLLPVLALALVPVLVSRSPGATTTRRWPLRVLAAAALVVAAGAVVSNGRALSVGAGGPRLAEDVRCLEAFAAQRGVRAGVARDYPARQVVVFTGGRLHVDQVTSELGPMTWIDDRERLDQYRFVVLAGLRRARVEERLGPPDERAECGELSAWFWSRPFAIGS